MLGSAKDREQSKGETYPVHSVRMVSTCYAGSNPVYAHTTYFVVPLKHTLVKSMSRNSPVMVGELLHRKAVSESELQASLD